MAETENTAEETVMASQDSRPFLELVQEFLNQDFAMNALVFVLVLLASFILGSIFSRMVHSVIKRQKKEMSALLVQFILAWVKRGTIVIGLVVALETVGVATAPIIASMGVAGFIIGFALKDTLSNFAAGMMLLFYRPFEIDDFIEVAGTNGIVTGLTIVSTTLRTPDNKVVIVPNGKAWGDVIVNFTRNSTRRMDMVLSVSYDADLDHVQKIVREFVEADAGVLDDPELTVEVLSMGESSIDFAVRPWVNTKEYWDVFWRMQKGLKQLMDQHNIEIPFPQRTVWMKEDK